MRQRGVAEWQRCDAIPGAGFTEEGGNAHWRGFGTLCIVSLFVGQGQFEASECEAAAK